MGASAPTQLTASGSLRVIKHRKRLECWLQRQPCSILVTTKKSIDQQFTILRNFTDPFIKETEELFKLKSHYSRKGVKGYRKSKSRKLRGKLNPFEQSEYLVSSEETQLNHLRGNSGKYWEYLARINYTFVWPEDTNVVRDFKPAAKRGYQEKVDIKIFVKNIFPFPKLGWQRYISKTPWPARSTAKALKVLCV